ncbi:PilZ domain-containing protein [Pelotomaculum propionicicum]|uniref:PilZ domain-containing protein n=1 Tax=Pelotomaculum propionicicum TaxID=258475 RepID=UPI003B7E4274
MAKKLNKLILIITMLLSLLTLMSTAAFCASDNPVKNFTDSVKDAFSGQAAAGQSYLGPFIAVTAVLLAVIAFLLRNQARLIKNKSVIWHINLNEPDGSGRQRRAWFRLPVNQYFLYAQDNSDFYERTKAINISGGGLLFATNEKPNLDEKLKIYINVAPGKKLILNGKVAWISENPEENQGNRFLVGIEFIDIKAGERDSIVGKILEKQQALIVESKRKANHECLTCGLPLPDDDRRADQSQCSKCGAPAEKMEVHSA